MLRHGVGNGRLGPWAGQDPQPPAAEPDPGAARLVSYGRLKLNPCKTTARARHTPRSPLRYPGAGHAFWFQDAARFLPAVARFCAQHRSRQVNAIVDLWHGIVLEADTPAPRRKNQND